MVFIVLYLLGINRKIGKNMKSMTNELRKQIQTYIKNRVDISDLLYNIDIKGEDLSRAVIKHLSLVDRDISGCNFSYTELGDDNRIFSIIRCNIRNCKFEGAKFIGRTFMRSCDADNCNFNNADVSLVDYQHTNFGENSTFCNAKITISTNSGIGCKFPKKMFYDLCKGWSMQIEVK